MFSGGPAASLAAPANTQTRVGRFRWFICGLLFYATTVNYMDRVVMGLLKPVIVQDLHWTETDYGKITAAFQIGYALMLPIAGRLIDWLGLRFGYALAALVWALSSFSHAFAGNLAQFTAARFGLGLGEAANFPSAVKAVADWFPRGERAFATGIFNSGTNVGAILAPLIIPFFVAKFGWHSAFIVTAAFSFSWIAVWLLFYREPEQQPLLSPAELAFIRADAPDAPQQRIPYLSLLRRRPTWAFIVAKFFTDPVWWFYLFWIPGFLADKYHVDLLHLGPPLIAIYLMADVGSIAGGWLSSALLKRGWDLGRARKTTLLFFACCVLAVVFVPLAAGNLWLTVLLLGIASGAHQGWSANAYTITSDCFPRNVVASVVGIGGLFGALGGALIQYLVGVWLDFSHKSYSPLFFAAGGIYLLTLFLIQLILPKFQQESL